MLFKMLLNDSIELWSWLDPARSVVRESGISEGSFLSGSGICSPFISEWAIHPINYLLSNYGIGLFLMEGSLPGIFVWRIRGKVSGGQTERVLNIRIDERQWDYLDSASLVWFPIKAEEIQKKQARRILWGCFRIPWCSNDSRISFQFANRTDGATILWGLLGIPCLEMILHKDLGFFESLIWWFFKHPQQTLTV